MIQQSLNLLRIKKNKTASEVLNILNKESGVYGLSGVSSDFRDVKAARAEGNKVAAAALDAYAYRVANTSELTQQL